MRRASHTPPAAAHFRHFWGATKRAQLREALTKPDALPYQPLQPALPIGLPLQPMTVEASYLAWPLLPELFPTSFPGVKTSRDDFLVDIDRDALVRRIEQYFDPAISHEEMGRIAPQIMQDSSGFKAKETRDYLLKRGFLPDNMVRYCYRPFDLRWLYWEPETKLLDRQRAEYFPHVFAGNVWIGAAQKVRREADAPYTTRWLASLHIVERGANFFPLSLAPQTMFEQADGGAPRLNLSEAAHAYLARIGTEEDAPHLFYHAVAVLHAPAYRRENAGALRQDWPRIPLPASRAALLRSAELGRQVAALLDPEAAVVGTTSSPVRPELAAIGGLARVDGGSISGAAGDLEMRAGWGYAGRGGITMPGRGRAIPREPTPDEQARLGDHAALLGAPLYDIALNDVACWRAIPARVWGYTLGGYQVINRARPDARRGP